MKILMLVDFYHPFFSGIEHHVQWLCEDLVKRGHDVTVCTIGTSNLPEYEVKEGVKIHRLQGLFQKIPLLYRNPGKKRPPPIQDWLLRLKLKKIVEQECPDIVHSHGWRLYSMLDLKKKLGIPLVHTLHDFRLFCPIIVPMRNGKICDSPFTADCIPCMRNHSGLLKAVLAYSALKRSRMNLRQVDLFLAVSDYVKHVHRRHLGIERHRIITIPNFCNAHEAAGSEVIPEVPDDFILFAGALTPIKGVDILIEAHWQLNTEVTLLILGIEVPDYHYHTTGNINIIRNAPHKAVFMAMSKCRFTVIPSICSEACAIVATEAMSQSKAVIATDVGGLKEMVVDGKTGILVPPGDASELSRAMSRLLREPDTARTMGENGYRRYADNYSLDAVVPRILDVYQELI